MRYRRPTLLLKNPVRQANQYYLKHWTALTRFLDDPLVPLDNNLAERLLRAVAIVGRTGCSLATRLSPSGRA